MQCKSFKCGYLKLHGKGVVTEAVTEEISDKVLMVVFLASLFV